MRRSRICYIVSINGILQAAASYKETSERIVFRQAPAAGDTIQIVASDGVNFSEYITYEGNGVTYIFHLPEVENFYQFMNDLEEYKDHPAVKDQIEKMQVILALVKQ
jgi:hypothetical protein